MNNHKIHTKPHQNDPERKPFIMPVYVRNTTIENAENKIIIARDAEMRLQQRAPKLARVPFTSSYGKFVTERGVSTSSDIAAKGNNKAKVSDKYEHVVAESLKDHKVTNKPQGGQLDFKDKSQESIDQFKAASMAADTTPELSEQQSVQPESPVNVDYSLEDRRTAKAESIEKARESVMNARLKERNEPNGDIQKPAA